MTKTRSQDRDRLAAEPAVSVLPQGSFGAWLRTQREARGVGLREIADASKIGLRYLEALEQNRFEILPAPVFTRGFLREYARIVGLDPDEVVNLYLLASAGDEEEDEPAEERATRSPGTPPPILYALLLLVAVAVLLGLAALVSYWAKPRAPAAEESPAIGDGATAPEMIHAEPAPDPTDPGAPVPPAGTGPSSPSLAADGGPLRVQLDFTEDCWVELLVDGLRRTSELRTGGEVVTIEAAESVLLTLGNPEGVRVEVDGRPLALPGDGARVVRDFRIDRQTASGQDAPEPRS